MPSYRRWRKDGACYFITLTTHEHRPFLCLPTARTLLKAAIEQERQRRPFTLDAMVLLPDHMHFLMTLPPGDVDYSTRIGQIKRTFTATWLLAGLEEGKSCHGRLRQRYRGVWQTRFWEHTIRDARDFAMHLDYIHSNPVKHGMVEWPRDWEWSSFHRYLEAGWYALDWCGHIEIMGMHYTEP